MLVKHKGRALHLLGGIVIKTRDFFVKTEMSLCCELKAKLACVTAINIKSKLIM